MAETNNSVAVLSSDNQLVLDEMKHNRNLLVAFTKDVLKKDVDFGVIPGVAKPSLLKPGAEKLQGLFKLSSEFTCVERVVDIPNKFLSFSYCCSVKDINGRILSQCEGNVNSYETKYRYNWVATNKRPTKDEGEKMKVEGIGKWRKNKDSTYTWMERRENPDVIGLQNTLMKMAQKRALVGAVLIATGASEFYTQDVEDMGFIDVETIDTDAVDVTPKSDPQPAPEIKAKATTKTKAKEAAPEPVKEARTVEEPSEQARVNSMLRKPTESEKAQGGPVIDIPQDTIDAIAAASTKNDLLAIYNECADLHTNLRFQEILSKRKQEIMKATAA